MHKCAIKTYFFDGDPAGVVFYGNIFKVMHSAYEDMIKKMRLETDYFNSDELAIPILQTEARYKKTIIPGELLTVEISPDNIRESTFELKYMIRNSAQELCVEAKTVHIFTSKKGFKKSSMPKEFKDALFELC